MYSKRIHIALMFCLTVATTLLGQDGASTVADLIRQREFHDRTTWSKEVLAQKYEQTFVKLWDSLIHRSDRFDVLRELQFDSIEVGSKYLDEDLDWSITQRSFQDSNFLTRSESHELLSEFQRDGSALVESERHHSTFVP